MVVSEDLQRFSPPEPPHPPKVSPDSSFPSYFLLCVLGYRPAGGDPLVWFITSLLYLICSTMVHFGQQKHFK